MDPTPPTHPTPRTNDAVPPARDLPADPLLDGWFAEAGMTPAEAKGGGRPVLAATWWGPATRGSVAEAIFGDEAELDDEGRRRREAAWAYLYLPYTRAVRRWLAFMKVAPGDLDDVLQETIMEFAQAVGRMTYDPEQSMRGLLRQHARWRLIDHVRHKQRDARRAEKLRAAFERADRGRAGVGWLDWATWRALRGGRVDLDDLLDREAEAVELARDELLSMTREAEDAPAGCPFVRQVTAAVQHVFFGSSNADVATLLGTDPVLARKDRQNGMKMLGDRCRAKLEAAEAGVLGTRPTPDAARTGRAAS